MSASFVTGVAFRLRVNEIVRSSLSVVPSAGLIDEKDVTLTRGADAPSARLTVAEHLREMVTRGDLPGDAPLLVFSARNVLRNARCIAFTRAGGAPNGRLHCVAEEVVDCQRPYHVLAARRDGGLVVEELWPATGDLSRLDWFVSGIPAVWDGESGSTLFARIVPEAADHSHVWRIPRGRHPAATSETARCFEDLHAIFTAALGATRDQAASLLSAAAEARGLARETLYLHNLMGVDGAGRLCQLVGAGMIEDLGQQMREAFGVERAIVVDNGGSVETWYCPDGPTGDNAVQLVSAPNLREGGSAYIGVALPPGGFETIAV